jgi:hypothetical protein
VNTKQEEEAMTYHPKHINELTVDEAVTLLEAVVEAFGEDYRYEYLPEDGLGDIGDTCQYATDFSPLAVEEGNQEPPTPRCIVGQVIAMCDPEDWWREPVVLNNSAADDGFDGSPAAEVLREAQVTQDTDGTWGDALKAARFRARRGTGRLY